MAYCLIAASCVGAGEAECLGDEVACAEADEAGRTGGRGGSGGSGGSGGAGGTDGEGTGDGTRPGGGGDGEGDSGGGGGGGGPPPLTTLCDTRTCDALLEAGVSSFPDYDGDGIADCIEWYDDNDGDGVPNCEDLDSDGDGIPDDVEGEDDADFDGIPNFLDLDSDGDGIYDVWETASDYDNDGLPNFLDIDSDDDGVQDAIEFGRTIGDPGPPIDRDGDGFPDFIDEDSDGDGLPDADERIGCPTTSFRELPDSDGDNIPDLVEVAFGSDPCDPASDIRGLVNFYFELPFLGPEESDTLQFGTDINRGDVVFNMDTTGSMGGEIDNLRSSLRNTIIPQIASVLPDAAYGISRFDDFPFSSFGGRGDVPFALLQRITRDATAAQNATQGLNAAGGGDTPESGIEALYQLATGVGRNECNASVPAFNPAAGLIPGTADGTIGGAGFRPGSVPIVVQITDAPTHARGERSYNCGATREEAYTALRAIGGRVIGVASDNAGRADLLQMARNTGAVVPACAWDDRRPAGCSPGQCCTQSNGRGRNADADGCPLVFDTDSNGNGLGTAIVSGIEALVLFAPITVTTRVRRDEREYEPGGRNVDTSTFITRITAINGIGGPRSCGGATPQPADLDGDGHFEAFINVTPGSRLFFQVDAQNNDVPDTTDPEVYLAWIDVMGNGTAVLDTQDVSILVPPRLKR